MRTTGEHWEDILWFWGRINQLLKETHQYEVMRSHKIREEWMQSVHEDNIYFECILTPPMQAIRWEMYHLEQEVYRVMEKQEPDHYLRWELELRHTLLFKFFGYLLKKELEIAKKGNLWEELNNNRAIGFIGDNWKMKFIKLGG